MESEETATKTTPSRSNSKMTTACAHNDMALSWPGRKCLYGAFSLISGIRVTRGGRVSWSRKPSDPTTRGSFPARHINVSSRQMRFVYKFWPSRSAPVYRVTRGPGCPYLLMNRPSVLRGCPSCWYDSTAAQTFIGVRFDGSSRQSRTSNYIFMTQTTPVRM